MNETIIAIIENGIVVQTLVATKNWAEINLGQTWLDVTNMNVGVGYTYDDETFRPPQPYTDWVWENDRWNPPIPYPIDGQVYMWDETQNIWILQPVIDETLHN